MAGRANFPARLNLGFLMIALVVGQCCAELKYGYYKGKCGKADAEKLIFKLVKKKMHDEGDKGLVGDFVRLSFHDCFVKGCDASIMLDGNHTEKMAAPNLDLDGFTDIDEIKAEVEKVCPGVVSCADVLVIATRATVYLVGAHTVGVVHCNNFQDRLYNYHNTGKPDPTMDPSLVKKLIKTCPKHLNGTQNEAFLDQTPGSEDTIDTSFYKNIMAHKGVIDFDQRMAYDPRTRGLVRAMAYDTLFSDKFGKAMIKLTKIGVLTGKEGEYPLRKNRQEIGKTETGIYLLAKGTCKTVSASAVKTNSATHSSSSPVSVEEE
ncbi:hypothetical protein V2J09_005607 [Rumex salicifolius]